MGAVRYKLKALKERIHEDSLFGMDRAVSGALTGRF
jgi:hypothetical protein